MSYLDRLKAMRSDPFVGFVGDGGMGVLPKQPVPGAEHGLNLLESLQTRSKSEVFQQKKPLAGQDVSPKTYPPQQPTKPTKACFGADLRNSLALYVPQIDLYRCHVCSEPETPDRPLVPVLNPAVKSSDSHAHHWVHHVGACHDEHIRRIAERVEVALADAPPF